MQSSKETKFPCIVCRKLYMAKSSLNRHMNQVHEIPVTTKISKIVCPNRECMIGFATREILREHIQSVHNVNIELVEKKFASYDEFKNWKNTIEEQENALYNKRHDNRTIENNTCYRKQIFVCHRSGFYSPHGKEKRKRLESRKINACCPSYMTATVTESGVKVRFWKTHYGHDNEIKHLYLSKKDKLEIMERMKLGIPYEKILEDVRNSVQHNEIKRINFLKRQDLRNIAQKYNIQVNQVKSSSESKKSENVITEIHDFELLKPSEKVLAQNDTFKLSISPTVVNQVISSSESKYEKICDSENVITENQDFESFKPSKKVSSENDTFKLSTSPTVVKLKKPSTYTITSENVISSNQDFESLEPAKSILCGNDAVKLKTYKLSPARKNTVLENCVKTIFNNAPGNPKSYLEPEALRATSEWLTDIFSRKFTEAKILAKSECRDLVTLEDINIVFSIDEEDIVSNDIEVWSDGKYNLSMK